MFNCYRGLLSACVIQDMLINTFHTVTYKTVIIAIYTYKINEEI